MRWFFAVAFLCVIADAQSIDYTRQIKNLPVADPRTYNWLRTNGLGASSDLSVAGVGKTISFTGCPAGMAAGSRVYLSGGTGTAESVPITATTCPAIGGGAGTITVTTSNTHTGSWVAASDTAGIQESFNAGYRSVLIPSGNYTVGTISLPSNALLAGTGRETVLVPRASSTTMIQMIGTPYNLMFSSTANIAIRDLKISGRDFPGNTAIGISISGEQFALIQNILFDAINYGVFLDKVQDVTVENIHLVDNTSIFVGSTTTPAVDLYPWSRHVQLSNIVHSQSNEATTVMDDGRKIIHVSRAIGSVIRGFEAHNLQHKAIGISVENHCEGIHIISPHIVVPKVGVQFLRTTVSEITSAPSWSTLSSGAIDLYDTRAVLIDDDSSLIKVTDMELSGNLPPTGNEVAAIEVQSAFRIQINGNRFGFIDLGDHINVNGTSHDIQINDNYFSDLDADSDMRSIRIASGANSDGLTIVGNTFDTDNNENSRVIANGASGQHVIHSNNGIDDIKGAEVTAATLITLTRPFHYVSGSAVITGINASDEQAAPHAYTGPVTIVPTSNATWVMTGGGNIVVPAGGCAASAGKAFQVRWVSADALWYVTGCAPVRHEIPAQSIVLANGDNDNIDIGAYGNFTVSGPSSGFAVTGFTGGASGRFLYLWNASGQQMTIKNEDAGSTEANRIQTNTGADVVLRNGNSSATVMYNSTASRWILMSSN